MHTSQTAALEELLQHPHLPPYLRALYSELRAQKNNEHAYPIDSAGEGGLPIYQVSWAICALCSTGNHLVKVSMMLSPWSMVLLVAAPKFSTATGMRRAMSSKQ